MSKKKETYIALIVGIIVLIGIVSLVINQEDNPDSTIYTIGMELALGETFTAIVHERDELTGQELATLLNYDLTTSPKVYAIDHPFRGYAVECGELRYEIYQEGDTLIIDEKQEPTCESPQNYYVTTLLSYSREFTQIRLNQYLNEELIDYYDLDIDLEIEKTGGEAAEEASVAEEV